MTLLQLEYIIAVDTYRSFTEASEHCFVTQPTLSMQIRKLEEELDAQLFDRNHKPIRPTEAGRLIIGQARKVVNAMGRLNEIVGELRNEIPGEISCGIIPTIAPYILPSILQKKNSILPEVRLDVAEETTENIVNRIRHDQLDMGILATPLEEEGIREHPLYYEPFVAFFHQDHPLLAKKRIKSTDISLDEMWLLTDGHCFRDQVINFCGLGGKTAHPGLNYTTGSLDSIVRVVHKSSGYTLLPLLAAEELPEQLKAQIRHFEPPIPVREISIITREDFLKVKLIEKIKKIVLEIVPEKLHSEDDEGERIPILHKND